MSESRLHVMILQKLQNVAIEKSSWYCDSDISIMRLKIGVL